MGTAMRQLQVEKGQLKSENLQLKFNTDKLKMELEQVKQELTTVKSGNFLSSSQENKSIDDLEVMHQKLQAEKDKEIQQLKEALSNVSNVDSHDAGDVETKVQEAHKKGFEEG